MFVLYNVFSRQLSCQANWCFIGCPVFRLKAFSFTFCDRVCHKRILSTSKKLTINLGQRENCNTFNRSCFFYEKRRLLTLRLGHYTSLRFESAIFWCNWSKQRFIFVWRKISEIKNKKKGKLKEKQQRNSTRSTTGEDWMKAVSNASFVPSRSKYRPLKAVMLQHDILSVSRGRN
jgi:hypothetical protein